MWVIPPYWEKAKQHLRNEDTIIGAIIDRLEDPPLRSKGQAFETIVHAIVGQQISAKAADSIWARFVQLVGVVDVESIRKISKESLRGVGLSGRKAEYILGMATNEAWLTDFTGEGMDDDAVRRRLITIRGVGPWTAEMVMMFSLLRPDVFPLGDIGIIRCMERLYNDGESLDKEELLSLADRWTPYKTVACWYLWRHLDAEPVQY